MNILFFAPHSQLWIHAFPEALVAESLQQQGHDVTYVTCGGVFSDLCVPMAAQKMTPSTPREERLRVCAECGTSAQLIRDNLKLSGPALHDMLDWADLDEVARVIATAEGNGVGELVYEGVPVGKIALYQVVLHFKKSDTSFSEAELAEYNVELKNTLHSLKAAQRLIERYKPDRVLMYNGLYSVNSVVAHLARSRGIPSYFLHAGSNSSKRLQTLVIGRDQPFLYMPTLLSQWPRFRDTPCTKRQLARATDHLLELFRGQSIFAYSRGKTAGHFDARDYFGVKRGQKLVIATMSSKDEYTAAILVGAQKPWNGLLFESQIEWIKALIEYAKRRPDIFLVVRVHPREFPNRRDARKSQHASALEAAFEGLPENARVNWPADNLSIYDLVDHADVFLNAWSTIGKDMPMLGLPVVVYSDQLPLYPTELNYLGDTLESYYGAIDAALKAPWSFDRVRLAYRWAVYEFMRTTFDIGDSYSELATHERSFAQRAIGRIGRAIDPDFAKRADIRRRRSRLGAAKPIDLLMNSAAIAPIELLSPEAVEQASLNEETEALQRELSRLAIALFPNAEARSGSRLFGRLMGTEAAV